MDRDLYDMCQPYADRHGHVGWVGMRSTVDVILGSRGVLKNGHMLFFIVLEHGILEYTTQEDAIL